MLKWRLLYFPFLVSHVVFGDEDMAHVIHGTEF